MNTKETLFPNLPQRIAGLGELAENLWWSWHPEARMLFKKLSRQGWKDSGHNPDKMLKETPQEILDSAAGDPSYLRHYDVVLSQFRREIAGRSSHPFDPATGGTIHPIAFFSAEYGLHHSLPFYAGGLGFLAGDFLKECSDLGIPLVAIGFMYPEGYLCQRIREDGWQEDREEVVDRDAASINRVLDEKGGHLVVKVPLIDPPVYVAVWRVDVGRVPLYLMDTDVDLNSPESRNLSSRLYTGHTEQRLHQEIVLGIGGAEVLEVMGIRPSVIHLNEGHPAFSLLERIRDLVQSSGMKSDEAIERVKATTIFTTHTPVPAGHDIFPFSLIEKYFSTYWASIGLDRDSFLGLGLHPDDPEGGFNMTVFALKMSGHINAVSKRHGEVTRSMWQSLWPGREVNEIPIGHVTNGVHLPTWIEPKMRLLFNRYFGADWLNNQDNPFLWELIEDVPDKELWEIHYWLKLKLINALREQARQRWNKGGAPVVLAGGTMLDPSVLTIGFARRFTTYKRADLILSDKERLKRLLHDRWKPIQIIFSGKAHPADDPGKRILQRIFRAASSPEMEGRIAFLEDYDEQKAQYMVHGVDVWLNNPIPPMEASGTSGMKAALNGVPHLSIMDGWWLEGYNGNNGWAFGHGQEANGENRDQQDAKSIYQILEEKVIPLYYKRSDDGVPHEWVRLMKDTIKSSAARFSARRMVKEYLQNYYYYGTS